MRYLVFIRFKYPRSFYTGKTQIRGFKALNEKALCKKIYKAYKLDFEYDSIRHVALELGRHCFNRHGRILDQGRYSLSIEKIKQIGEKNSYGY